MITRKIGVGVIGCGSRIRDVISRTLASDSTDSIRVTALCDPNPAAIETFGKICNCQEAAVYSDYNELANYPSVDWVAIGSWNIYHKEHILAALKADKHIFCEKPLATTLEDCMILQDAIRASNKLFSMGFVLRYAPFYRRLKELIDEGVLGRLISFEFNETLAFNHGGYIMSDWRRLRKNAGTHMLEKCCHDVDLANWLTGSIPVRASSFGGLDFFTPENVHQMKRIGKNKDGQNAYETWKPIGIYTSEHDVNAFTGEKDIIDNQVTIMEYANGARATFHTNLNTGIPERRFYLCGTEGTIRGDVLTGEIEWKKIGWEPEISHEHTVGGGHGGADDILAEYLCKSMLEGILPAANLEDGLKSAIAVFGIDEAMESGQVFDMIPNWNRVGISTT